MTAHHAIGIKVRDEELAAHVGFSWSSADQHDDTQLEAMRDAVEKLRIQVAAVGDVSDSPFHLVAKGDWSPQWEGEVVERAGRLSGTASAVNHACEVLMGAIGITIPDHSMERLDGVADLAAVLMDAYRKQTAYALEPDGSDRIETLEEAVQRLKNYADAQAGLSCAYAPMAWRNLDGDEIAKRWREAQEVWWPKRFFARRRVIKEMKIAGAQGTPDPERDASTLKRLRGEGEAIDRLDTDLSNFKEWEGHTTAPDVALALEALGRAARNAVGKLADNAQALVDVRGKVRNLMYDGNDLLAPEAAVGRAAQNFLSAHQMLHETCEAFKAIAGQSVREHFMETETALDAIRDTADSIATRHAELHDWCGWRRRRTEAMDLGLAPLIEAIEKGLVPTEEIGETFEAAYCTWWSGMVIGEDDVLRTFSLSEHVADIEKFRKIDDNFQALTAAYIEAKLAGNLPGAEDVKRKSSWGVLRHELQKKTRHKPVRQLIQEIPDVLTTLAPCLMMSPLSVAQYLPAEQALFDVVIFDEASQITVWDAVGALARGRQSIIAGDPKQMPPTNFFARSDDDPDGDVNAEGDLESILDEMLGACIPQRTLNLHYRSRRESLIAFSNSRYYDNGLITFPAPVHLDHGVRLIRPEGFYARGKARHNQGEAKAIVAKILHRLTHTNPDVRKRSIGVVTFNTEQQSLIENLLDDARSKNPDIEWAFSSESTLEPVFVKNLETVQGDERDVILFSITYGPDQSGHITMNFGPLNREGGERRLNVAMTRSRYEMLVFSTLSPDKIDLSRTQARGVADMKHFLEYAERGPSALGAATHGSVGDFESPFEIAVARALRDKGWNVHPQIGVSAYRIDLGITHPDEPGVYLAGIECDGAMYHSSAYARERDKIRQSVLEGLGWTLFRVWSTDWWTHRTKAIETLHAVLQDHLEADRIKREDESQASEVIVTEPSPSPELVYNDDDKCEFGPNFNPPVSPTAAHLSMPQIATEEVSPPQTLESAGNMLNNEYHTYVVTHFNGEQYQSDPDMFYSTEYEPRLSEMIDLVIDTEGPIHIDLLIRRITRHHGFKRAGRHIRDIIIKIAKRHRHETTEDVGTFFWPEETVTGHVQPARYKNRDNEMRKVEYICKKEIAEINKLLSLDDDPVEIARSIGIYRLTRTARERLSNALDVNNQKDL